MIKKTGHIANRLKHLIVLGCLVLGSLCAAISAEASSGVRIKDIVNVQGMRGNMLIGYGLVIGLNGTGDTIKDTPFTKEGLVTTLERLGINTRGQEMKPYNVAAVMVTATLPAFSKTGDGVDVTVSTIGNATDISGGTLIVTPLTGADGNVYAVAQGAVVVPGYTAKGESGSSVLKGVPTRGTVTNGATVEREVNFSMSQLKTVHMTLKNPDFTTACRIADRINKYLKVRAAKALNPTNVTLKLTPKQQQNIVPFLSGIERLTIVPDQRARVIIDESSGVIVIGENVRISTVAIAQGNLTIKITETEEVSQPTPLSQGQTVVTKKSQIDVFQEDQKLAIMRGSVTLQELVRGLNELGVSPRDIIAILTSIKAAGALQADIEVI